MLIFYRWASFTKNAAVSLILGSASSVIRRSIGSASLGSCLLMPYRAAIRAGIQTLGSSARS
jgi:hypothetical protein